MAKQHVENKNYRDVAPLPWQPQGLPAGATQRPLSTDPADGAFTGILEFDQGFRADEHRRCSAEMQFFVLDGRLRMGTDVLGPGSYCFYGAGASQSTWLAETPVRLLAIFSEEPRFEPQAGDGSVETIRSLDTWAMQWTDPLDASDPSVPFRTGVMVKVLRVDPNTGASTHLAGLMPGWFSLGMETHPVYEENYCLSGDVCVAEVGKDPGYAMVEGAFLCRPPHIAHGPVLSKNGNVNFIYAHGRLGIDYVENLRSEELVTRHLHTFPWR